MEMEDTEFRQRLKYITEWQLRSLELKTRNYIEWSQFRHVLQNELVNAVLSTALKLFRVQERNNRLLVTLNQS